MSEGESESDKTPSRRIGEKRLGGILAKNAERPRGEVKMERESG